MAARTDRAVTAGSRLLEQGQRRQWEGRLTVLGTKNPATGSPIKIGVVTGGEGPEADTTGQVTTAQAAADYANDYLGGLNGHKIELVSCLTQWKASNATQCGINMIKQKVAVVIASGFGEDLYVSNVLDGKGIPYITNSSAAMAISGHPGFYLLNNPFVALGTMLALADQQNLKKGAIVIPDVPAAAVVGDLTKGMFDAAGLEQDFIQIGLNVADHTSQMQKAVDNGDQIFEITGNESFYANAIKGLHNVGFDGSIVISLSEITPTLVQQSGGLQGVVNTVPTTFDPADPDVKVYNAAIAKYAPGAKLNANDEQSFIILVSAVRMLAGRPEAVDGKSIINALDNMKAPAALFMGAGIMENCDHTNPLFPNTCTGQAIQQELDKDGKAVSSSVIDGGKYLNSF